MNFVKIDIIICLTFLTIFQENSRCPIEGKADVGTLQLIQVVFRHGNRTPLENTFPLDPYGDESYWPEGWAQLTNAGKQAQFKLGEFLRLRYDGFLGKKYSRSEVYVQSSDLDRTIGSALTNLAGLFPPEAAEDIWNKKLKWQPIPVHSLHSKIDNKINFLADCPKYKLRLDQLLQSPFVKKINSANQKLYNYLSHHSGRFVLDFNVVAEIYNTLSIHKENGHQLPKWAEHVFPQRMMALAILPFDLITFTEEMIQLRAGPLLEEVIHHMNIEVNKELKFPPYRRPKLYMYSGHDTTVATLLKALGVYDKAHIPGYTAMVMIELHQKSGESTPFVKVFYRNESSIPPRQVEIPGCRNSEGVCYLEKFKEILTPRTLNDDNFLSFCTIKEVDLEYKFPEQKCEEHPGIVGSFVNHLYEFFDFYIGT